MTPSKVNLSGPDGNAFVLLMYAKQYCNELGIDSVPVVADMKSSDYEHLISVFRETFSEYVEIV